MKKLLAIVLAAVLVLSAFAGCGKQTDTTAPNAENKEQTGTQSTTSDGGSLVIWVEKSFSEDVDKLFDERIQAFGQEKGVKVKAEFISATDYMTKLNAAVEAGNVPDLTLVNPYKVVSYYPGNPFSDVTDLVEEIDGQRPMFDALKNGTKIEGVNYFVPFYAASSLLFLRKDVFEAKGVALPTTWEELWDAAVAISDPDNGFYGLGMGCGPTDEDCENSFRMMMWDMGGSLMDKDGKIDFADKTVTENTRVSYPIDHIQNIVRPISSAPAAKNVIFLSADAFGVLPPVSILTPAQTQYYFLSGFTAKLAGTERGITEPTPTFSACFGQAFLELHPTKYAEELVKKMEKSGAKAYLVNTGWNGTGKRISIKDTRGIIDAILSGAINEAPTKKIPYFDFEVPTSLPGVDPAILDPRDTYADAAEWNKKAEDLAGRFIKNFAKYEGNEHGKALVSAGPQL